jgi:hypothetical protein
MRFPSFFAVWRMSNKAKITAFAMKVYRKMSNNNIYDIKKE